MTVKEIYEKTVFGNLNPAGVEDYKVIYCGGMKYNLEMYKKGLRKNAAKKYLTYLNLLNQEAVVVKTTDLKVPNYTIITTRTLNGPFSRPLNNNEEIILK